MQELRKIIENNICTTNQQIVDTQRKIDKLFEQYLKNPMINNKVEIESKNQDKFYYYGWIGALESILKKINELEEKDNLEFKLALEQLVITKRDLKSDCLL